MNLNKFRKPSAKYRPAPFWSWNDRLDEAELKRQIREMSDKGWGSYFMHSRVGLVTEYLSDEWMEMIGACIKEAAATGTKAWLYDEDKWPSGFAGGRVTENPDYRSRALVLLKGNELTQLDTILKEYEHEGEKYYISNRISAANDKWFNNTCYADLMNPKAVRAFLEYTHEEYKKHFGDHFGKEIPGIFTDEPCYMMHNRNDMPALPWSEYLPPFFAKLKGYKIQEHLPELFFDIKDYNLIRFDFYDVATRLFVESFTKQYYRWCEENNLIMTGHFMAEDEMPYQTKWIGAAMPHYEFMHWPGIDKLERNINQLVTVKQVTSATDQLGKQRALCEVFGCIGQQSSFYHRKWIADWQAALGISFVNSHLSLYSTRGERKRDYPANLFYQQPWWEDEKPFADYVARLSYAVSQGKREVDILVLHAIGSVWCEYSPLHKGDECSNEDKYDKAFTTLSKALIENKLDFHYGDEIIMQRYGRIENSRLIIGEHAYTTVVVPPALNIRSNTVKLLDEFVLQAGSDKLVFMHPSPTKVDGTTSTVHLSSMGKSINSIDALAAYLDTLYKDRISITDSLTGSNAKSVICHDRILAGGRLLLVVNTDENKEIDLEISIKERNKPIVADLFTGDIYTLDDKDICIVKEKRVTLRAKLYPAGSLLLYWSEPNKKLAGLKQLPAILDSGVSFTNSFSMAGKLENLTVTLTEPNVLVLNDMTLYMNGKLVLKDQPVARAWHEYFYPSTEGTPFEVEYTFDILNVPNGECFAAVEVADNLDRITINGVEVKPLMPQNNANTLTFDPDRNWKDTSLVKVPIGKHLLQGNNVLTLKGKKSNNITGHGTHEPVKRFKEHRPTEVEAVYIIGDFAVINENNTRFYIDAKGPKLDHRDLTRSGCPFYAGSAVFTGIINIKAELLGRISTEDKSRIYLRLDDVKAASARIYVNGNDIGVKYLSPFIYDITDTVKEGVNDIEVIAPTTLFNLLGPNRYENILDKTRVNPCDFTNTEHFTDKYTLVPFGIGGASIVVHQTLCYTTDSAP